MREIKFRGKPKYKLSNTPDWIYGCYVIVEGGHYILSKHPDIYEQTNASNIIDIKTLGQFTGLTDKNGKEIYEGDILRIHPNSDEFHNVEVVFYQGCFCYTRKGAYFTFYSNVPGMNFTKDREIIGNIYKNPELLEKK